MPKLLHLAGALSPCTTTLWHFPALRSWQPAPPVLKQTHMLSLLYQHGGVSSSSSSIMPVYYSQDDCEQQPPHLQDYGGTRSSPRTEMVVCVILVFFLFCIPVGRSTKCTAAAENANTNMTGHFLVRKVSPHEVATKVSRRIDN